MWSQTTKLLPNDPKRRKVDPDDENNNNDDDDKDVGAVKLSKKPVDVHEDFKPEPNVVPLKDLPPNILQCPICPRKEKTHYALKNHYSKFHVNKFNYYCEVKDCGKGFMNKNGWRNHKSQHDEALQKAGTTCGKKWGILRPLVTL